MNPRLKDLPVYEFRLSQVDAAQYNLVQVALKRIAPSLCYPLPKLRNLELIVEKDAWIIIDRSLNDIPIAAWMNFDTSQRSNLHEPVACHLRLYHMHANLILARTLEAMQLLVGEQLSDNTTDADFSVLPFHN